MAFLKKARAAVTKPSIDLSGWNKIRVASTGGIPFTKESAKVVLQQYDPAQFLLTHCTIVASVDTEAVNAPLGTQTVDGQQIDRRYADFYITPKTEKYINNNHDSFERKLLQSSFRTFIGAENFCEHLQIQALSKGKIVDAAIRDIGESAYVDILVATDRKHKPLVEAITTGKMQTLSMGANVQFTICTKCGNVAYDETQLCVHIKFQKGTEFYDELGNKRKVAEICGHVSSEPGSVRFIEASWVANPAFTGAVLRSILTPEEASALGPQIHLAHLNAPQSNDTWLARAASVNEAPLHIGSAQYPALRDKAAQFDFSAPTDGGGSDAGGGDDKKEEDPVDKIVSDLKNAIRERAFKDLRSEIGKGEAAQLSDGNDNETLIKSAMRHPSWRRIARTVLGMSGKDIGVAKRILIGLIMHKTGGWKAVAEAKLLNGREMLAVSRVLDHTVRRASMAGEARIYRTVVAVGGTSPYRNAREYLTACQKMIGRGLTDTEKALLIQKGRIFSLGS